MKLINPTLRQVEAFVLICRLGSVTAAAERMRLTQSAVSILLGHLERGLGAQLLDRTTRSLRPTAAGQEMLARGERLLRDRDAMVGAISAIRDVERGTLSCAVTAAVASALMPEVLVRFTREYPDIEIAMHDVAPDQLIPKVLGEDVEFSIGTVDANVSNVGLETLVSDRLSAICLRQHRFAARTSLGWDEVLKEPCISVAPGTPIRDLVDGTLARKGLRIAPKWQVSLLTTALSMTAHGLGIAILPGYLIPHLQYPMLIAVPLKNPVVRRNLSVIFRQGTSLSPAARAFIETFRRAGARSAQA